MIILLLLLILCCSALTQVGVVETSDDSYLMEPVSGSAHIAYEVKRSPLPEVKNIGGANDEGGRNILLLVDFLLFILVFV